MKKHWHTATLTSFLWLRLPRCPLPLIALKLQIYLEDKTQRQLTDLCSACAVAELRSLCVNSAII